MTDSKAAHTAGPPRPWAVQVYNQTIDVKYKPVTITDAHGYTILRVGDDKEARALAELIIRAVNAYLANEGADGVPKEPTR